MTNLNLLFNKTYYSGLRAENSTGFEEHNKEICAARFQAEDYKALDSEICPHTFLLKTTYPGLLVGTGYAHETGDGSDACVKLGFSFDYVTGQPYVPGSSVKGMLRSCFRKDVIPEVLREKEIAEACSEDDLDALKQDIFDGHDIFFDAVVRSGDKDGYIMATDYITPHGKDKDGKRDETKNPTPLLMVKVRPGVVFEFRFQLHDFTNGSMRVTAVQKKKLFQELITLFGIGAKTNVGYGALESVDHIAQAQIGASQIAQQAQASAVSSPAAPQKKTCPGCKKKNTVPPGKVVCPECEKKVKATGKCAICQKNKPAPLFGSDILCASCIVKFKP